ncbi:MAG: hydrogenase maturation nickel metallochaperone HypA [Myxococcales bacterium]|nr:hydrogenase maturation nickel metallochaperone HypA [Myxococcales bacterium]
MHEASIAEALLEQIAEAALRHGARRVVGARVAVGALSAVEPQALAFAFEVMRAGTVAAACELVIEERPLVVSCAACGHSGPQDPREPGCPRCQAVPVSVVSGRELCLVSVDVEDDDARAT